MTTKKAQKHTHSVISPVNVEARQNIGIRSGDTVRVHQKIEEKGKTRLQVFEGLVLSVKHGTEPGATFTVRRVASGVGVEKIFPLYSPMIDKIEIVRRSKVRRAKLYYIREKVAKEIRRQMRNMRLMDLSTGSDTEAKATAEDGEASAEEEPQKQVEPKATEVSVENPEAKEENDTGTSDSPEEEVPPENSKEKKE